MRSENRKCYIYTIEAISGSKLGWKYVGQHKERNVSRNVEHFRDLKNKSHFNIKLQRYHNKYGKDSLKFSILFECNEKELNFWERFFVNCFDSYKNGFNCTWGGDSREHLGKKCILKNFITNELVEYSSRKEFCNKYDLDENSICSLLSGKYNHVGDWYNPNKKWRPKYYIVISPSGERYEFVNVRMRDFCDKHDIEYHNIYKLVNYKAEYTRGWTRPDSKITNRGRIIYFELINPNGDIIYGNNLSKFAKENNLNPRNLSNVLRGDSKSYKGWRKYIKGTQTTAYIKGVEYKLINALGEIYTTFNLKQFSKEHNLGRSDQLYDVWNGKRKQYKGWEKYG